MKSLLAMSCVVARKPAVSTLAPDPNRMPSGLTRKTRPFDHSDPSNCEGPSPPVTRSSCTELALGMAMLVFSPAPILNVFQLTMALLVCCVTVTVAVPWPCTVALPPTTWPPSGFATAGASPSGTKAVVANSNFCKRPNIGLPLIVSRDGEEEPPIVARSVNCLRGLEIGTEILQDGQAQSHADRRTMHRRVGTGRRIAGVEPSIVGEGVELCLRNLRYHRH